MSTFGELFEGKKSISKYICEKDTTFLLYYYTHSHPHELQYHSGLKNHVFKSWKIFFGLSLFCWEKNKQKVIKEHIAGGKIATLIKKRIKTIFKRRNFCQGHPQLLQSGSSHPTVQPFINFH